MTEPRKTPRTGPSQDQLMALHLQGLRQRPVPGPLLELVLRLQALLRDAERSG
jgi:hypothetical protein